jgi:hypothetical protein
MEQLKTIASLGFLKNLKGTDRCKFSEVKVFRFQNSGDKNVEAFKSTGLNLDRYQDIQKLIGVNLMSQGKNTLPGGAPAFSPKTFPALYSCNDPNYQKHFSNFISK